MYDILVAFGRCCVGALGLLGAFYVFVTMFAPRKDRKGGFTK